MESKNRHAKSTAQFRQALLKLFATYILKRVCIFDEIYYLLMHFAHSGLKFCVFGQPKFRFFGVVLHETVNAVWALQQNMIFTPLCRMVNISHDWGLHQINSKEFERV